MKIRDTRSICDTMRGDPLQGRRDHPAIQALRQVVALDRRQKRARRHDAARLVAHANQQLVVALRLSVALQRNDGLRFEKESVVVERSLDPRDPLHFAVTLRDQRVVFLVDVNSIAALILGRVAGRVRRLQNLRDAPEGRRDRHESNTRAHGERAIPPHEGVMLDRFEQAVRHHDRIVDAAVVQEQPEFVAAQAGERVIASDPTLQDVRELPEQLVAGDVAAGVVDDLELIQVQVADRVRRARLYGVQGPLQAQLELAPVDQAQSAS